MSERFRGRLIPSAAALWTASLALMVAGSATEAESMRGWSLLIGLWACVATGWLLLDQERARVETIAHLLAERKPEGLRQL